MYAWIVSLLLLVGYAPMASVSVLGDSDTETLERAFSSGEAAQLAPLLAPTLELRILEDENVYSKQQAAMVLETFFRKNPIKSFKVVHSSTRGGKGFFIGQLECNAQSYRVTIMLKATGLEGAISRIQILQSGS